MALIDSKTLDDLRVVQLQKWQELVSNANIGTDSMIYVDATVIAEVLYLLQQDTITLVNNAFIAYATADELTNLGEDRGIPRISGVNASGTATFSRASIASQDYTIEQGTIVSTQPEIDGTSIRFTTDSEAILYGKIATPTGLVAGGNSTGGSITAETYQYKVSAVSVDGKETDPSTLAEVVIASGTTNSIDLSWTAVTSAASYIVYLSVGGGDFIKLADSITTASYTDTTGDTGSETQEPQTTNQTGNLSVSVAITATLTGDESNVAANTITNFITKPTGIEYVTNASALTGGLDEESDTTYRARIRDVLGNNNGKVTVSGYKQTAEAVSGVSSAFVVKNPSGGALANEISVYIIAANDTGVPSSELIAQVQAELDSDDNRAVCDDITVLAPDIVTVDVTVNVSEYESTTYTESSVTSAIETAIAEYLQTVEIGGTIRVVDIQNAIYEVYSVNDFTVSTPSSNTTLDTTEVAVAGTITVTFS